MGETKKDKKPNEKLVQDGLKAEFQKIVWPDNKSLTKQTGVVA